MVGIFPPSIQVVSRIFGIKNTFIMKGFVYGKTYNVKDLDRCSLDIKIDEKELRKRKELKVGIIPHMTGVNC